MKIRLLLFVLCFVLPLAAEKGDDDKPKKDMDVEKKESLGPEPVTKMVNGPNFDYRVTAETIALPKPDEPGKDRAKIFYISYEIESDKPRPIAFCFNGGPGSSSVWLHLGMLGPKRVELDAAGLGTTLAEPPYGVVENEHSILEFCDLVFIDPVSTGFSRSEEKDDAKDFHGLEGDIESVGAFIHQYCSKHGRWDSAKYLIGESYGGIRAAGLANHLQSRYGMYLNGLVLVSAVVDFGTLRFGQGNDNPYVFFLPCYAAVAKYHGQIEGESPEVVYREALEFANGEYHAALFAGSTLSAEKRGAIIEKLVRFTGLTADEIDRANLRLGSSYFRKLMMREEGKSVGRFDARVVGIDADKAGNYPDYDASSAVIMGPFSTAMNAYLREEIGVESEEVYEFITGKVHPWDYKPFTNRYVHLGDRLTAAMTNNSHLRIFVAAGYYDLATPPAAIEHTLSHLEIDPSLRENIVVRYYDGGHMMYTNLSELEKMKADLAQFIR